MRYWPASGDGDCDRDRDGERSKKTISIKGGSPFYIYIKYEQMQRSSAELVRFSHFPFHSCLFDLFRKYHDLAWWSLFRFLCLLICVACTYYIYIHGNLLNYELGLMTEEREYNPPLAKESLLLLGVCSLFSCHWVIFICHLIICYALHIFLCLI